VIALVAVEAGWRAWRRSPHGDIAARLEGILLLVLAVAIAGGLGLLVGGARPRELLHFVYAIVVLSALPIAGTLTKDASPRARGLASVAGALVALVVVARLFGTG
jgi:hypothetical protein